MILRTTTCASVLALTVLICGCDDGPEPIPIPVMVDDHAGHDHGGAGHPETLGDALHQLTQLRDTVRDAFSLGNSESAHGPLHDVGHLVDEVSELAGKADISDESKAAIDSNLEVLMDSFGAVDKKMHSEDEGSDYSEVSEKIDAALAAIVKAAGAAGEHDEHDEHGDHDEHGEDHHDDDDADHKDGHDEKEGHDKAAEHKDEK